MSSSCSGLTTVTVGLLVMFVLGVFVPLCSSQTSNSPTYVVVAPHTVRPGWSYDVSVTIVNAASDVNVDVMLRDLRRVVVVSQRATISPGSSHLVSLQAPSSLSGGSCSLHVKGSGGLTFNSSRTVTVKYKTLSLFIQTDKAMYKPGQRVLLRVISVHPDLKPFSDNVNVSIADPSGNKIAEWTNFQSRTGVSNSSLQLSDQPPLGAWVITATANETTAVKTIYVAEYVLPKYEVTVSLPSYYLLLLNNPAMQQNLRATISARYTYGQPVKGRAAVSMSIQPYSAFDTQRYSFQTFDVELVNGSADIEVTPGQLVAMLPRPSSSHYNNTLFYLNSRVVVVVANVTEQATGTTLSGNNSVSCTDRKYKLSFLDITPTNFKPGLITSAYLQLKQYDDAPPLPADIESSVVTVVTTFYFSTSRRTETRNLTVPASGLMTFATFVDAETTRLYLEATFTDERSNTTTRAYKSLEKFNSRDEEGIQVTLDNANGIVEAGQTVFFTIMTTRNITTFSYQLLSKGIIFQSSMEQSDMPQATHQLSLVIDSRLAQKLAPNARIIVWYITERGEIVCDSLNFNVNGAFINEVSVEFSEGQVQPSEDVTVSVSAFPDSYVGLLAVDQSVLLLRSGNDITQDSVLAELSKYESISTPTNYYPVDRPPPVGATPPAGLADLPVVGMPAPTRRRRRRSLCFRRCWWPYFSGGTSASEVFSNAGVIVITDGYIDVNTDYYSWLGQPGPGEGVPGVPGPAPPNVPTDRDRTDDSDGDADRSSPVRVDFPETWIWTDLTTDADGRTSMKVTVPDTITSWTLSAFAISPDVGLGVAPQPATLTAFKPFFISPTLPYSVTRGEEFVLQVAVFNYLSTSQKVIVTLKRSDDFVVRAPNDVQPQSQTISATVEVASMDAKPAYFWIIPQRLGQIAIEVSATSGTAADAARHLLLVKPEGVESEYSTSVFISLSAGETYNNILNISLPADGVLVPNSQYLQVTAIGDLMGQSLDGLGDLLQMPSGCGEQNMLHFAPDVYILKYLQATGQTAAPIVEKARSYINSGYQRELTYQRSDGSFSAFGERDKSGSTWLSAFVIKCFHEARDFIPVQESKIASTLNWLFQVQARNGSFLEPGRVIHRDMQGGSAGGVSLTAYVLISLLENSDNTMVSASTFQTVRSRAVQYLESQWSSISSDVYAVSIVTYGLTLANSSLANTAFNTLNQLAINKDGLRYWHKPTDTDMTSPPRPMWRPPYERARSVDIEMTSYALLTYTHRRDISGGISIVRWIVSQRNSLGGFSSTQDTVMALQALTEYAALTSGNNAGQNLEVSLVAASLSHTFHIRQDNALVLQSVQLPSTASEVQLQASGSGVGLIQLNVKYYVYGIMATTGRIQKRQTPDDDSSTNINVGLRQHQTDDTHLQLVTCARWMGSEVSGMAIMEVNLPTGHRADNANQLVSQSQTAKRVDVDQSKIVIYLDELTEIDVCFNLSLTKYLIVDNVQPAAVTSYLYYDPTEKQTIVYQPVMIVNSTWCDQCPSCCTCDEASFYQCPNGGPCLDLARRCDGVNDCSTTDDPAADEMSCNHGGLRAMTLSSMNLLVGVLGVTWIVVCHLLQPSPV